MHIRVFARGMSSDRGVDVWVRLPCNVEDALGLKSSGRSDNEETRMFHSIRF